MDPSDPVIRFLRDCAAADVIEAYGSLNKIPPVTFVSQVVFVYVEKINGKDN